MTLKTRKDICGNCLFHAEVSGSNGGQRDIECRYNPPTVFSFMVPMGPAPGILANPQGGKQQQIGIKFTSAYPTLDPENWCGRHKPEESSG